MNTTLTFYQDANPHVCSYLADQMAQNIYPDPQIRMTNQLYSQLIQHGFRRSGDMSYRPHCPTCQRCVPVRINVNQFQANRSQRRCLKQNQHLTITHTPARFSEAHYQLYCDYLATRHLVCGMDDPTQDNYRNFLISHWCETSFIEFREHEKLVAVAVTDHVHDGLSAFYTFFDPNLSKQSLGTFAILQQLSIAKSQNLSWLYLGYWIEECQKMRYKQCFSALEGYIDQRWQPLKHEKL
ncbi:MAG: arginyltransferase [Gammaproteobacteria bacterium]|nr:arginyltransferase [Gammaproteobacteria bacterium]